MRAVIKKILNKNSRKKDCGSFCHELEKIILFSPNDFEIYKAAFTHKSANNNSKIKGNEINFERLEFLGDAILGSVVAIFLFHKAPSKSEGYMTKMRSKFVSRNHLNMIGEELGLLKNLAIAQNKEQLGENIHGNLLEALIGAIYIDKGFDYAEAFIYRNIIKKYKNLAVVENKIASYKSVLFEYAQKNKIKIEYIIKELPNRNGPLFYCELLLNGKLFAKSKEGSKKKAEEAASEIAYKKISKNEQFS